MYMHYDKLRVRGFENYSDALNKLVELFNQACPYSRQEFVEKYGFPFGSYSVI